MLKFRQVLFNYILVGISVTAITSGGTFLYYSSPDIVSTILPICIAWLLNLIALYLAYTDIKARTNDFMQKLFSGMSIKLIASLIFILVALKFLPIHKGLFIGSYFFAYFTFTIFEVIVLINKLRAN